MNRDAGEVGPLRIVALSPIEADECGSPNDLLGAGLLRALAGRLSVRA